ncbi:S-layer homology domain-containing protein [Paenibacillus sp. Marseille-Q4541]|uniref:S-layer homology domain-containing protein n=1 Tax=Paenibacillus sp. Marseille-Q4541 TaxID=2831522 RepID=UPI001BA6D38F|nr:S-layer homology domain-containing protein [Paenibacillus sp. Marseille-Q4541]
MNKKKWTYKWIAISVAMGIMICTISAGPVSAATEVANTKAASETALPIVRLVPSTYQAKVGDTIEVAIWLQGFTGDYSKVQGYEVHMDFDASLLAPSSDSKKLTPSIFKKTSSPMSLVNKIDQTGSVQIAEAITSKDAKLFTGYGKVGTVSFRALKAGSATLKQSKSIIIQPDNPGINIKHRINQPTITILANGTATDKVNEKTQTIGEPAVKKVSLPSASQTLAGFKDKGAISKLKWAQDSIVKLAATEVLQGTSEGNFEPLRDMTRAEFAKSAVVALGLDMKQQPVPTFSDVNTSDWYYDYVETAGKYGLIQGLKDKQGNLKFNPSASVTRAELTAILARQLKSSGKGMTADNSNPFTDITSHWAQNDIIYLYGNKLIQGKTATKFHPGAPASRAEVSVLLERIQQALK